MSKHKQKVKVVYREKKEEKPKYTEEMARANINKLQESKMQAGKGWRGFLRKMNINNQINQQASFLKSKQKERNIEAKIGQINQQVKLVEAQNKLGELRKKNQVHFDNLPFQMNKQIKFEELF
jgi:hypothetical protein